MGRGPEVQQILSRNVTSCLSGVGVALFLFAFHFCVICVSLNRELVQWTAGRAATEASLHPGYDAGHVPPHGRGGEVEDEWIQTGVEGAAQQSLVSPLWTLPLDEAHDVGHVVGSETDSKDQQRSNSHADGPQTSVSVDALQLGQDPDKVDVAEAADQEWDAEEDNAELQTHWEEDLQLSIREVLVTNFGLCGCSDRRVLTQVLWRRFIPNKSNNEDDVDVKDGENPEEDASSNSVERPALQCVLYRKSHTQVPLYTDGREAEGAVVDGQEENEA